MLTGTTPPAKQNITNWWLLFFAFQPLTYNSMSQNQTEGPMPDRILSTPLPGPRMTESEDAIAYPPSEDPIATSQERVDITHSAVDSHDEQEQEQSQILHSISQSPSPARQSPFPDNIMTKQFASISLSSTHLSQERSLTPPFWDLSPDESSPSRTIDEGPPAASLLLDATQSVEVVQSKSEDGQVSQSDNLVLRKLLKEHRD